jgi:hypothetical protein
MVFGGLSSMVDVVALLPENTDVMLQMFNTFFKTFVSIDEVFKVSSTSL